MKHLAFFLLLVLPGRAGAPPQDVPSELARLVAKARLDGPVAAWCRAEFRPGHPGAFAAAVTHPAGGGRYVALEADGRTTVLASFTSTPDLSCYTRARAGRRADDLVLFSGLLMCRDPERTSCAPAALRIGRAAYDVTL
jgi:hypothetical protein